VTEKQKSTKRLGKAVVVLLALGSLLGIGAAPAAATDWDQNNPTWQIDVAVTDTSCVPDYTQAIWAPDPVMSLGNTNIDMVAPTSIDFSVSLNFSSGTDRNACGGFDVPPSGTVTASYKTISPELSQDRLDCSPSCILSDPAMLNTITGSLSVVPGTLAGDYSATLQVVWTPTDS
jgi:hypothetical protein